MIRFTKTTVGGETVFKAIYSFEATQIPNIKISSSCKAPLLSMLLLTQANTSKSLIKFVMTISVKCHAPKVILRS